MGVNWVFSVFLDVGDGIEKFRARAFYSVHSHRSHADWIADNIPHFLGNCFFILHPQSYEKYCRRQDFNEDPYWIRNSFRPGDAKASDAAFEAMAKCIMAKRDDCRYLCRGTTLHWAIAVAIVLGAKKVYVVGAEARGDYMHKHGSMYTWESGYHYRHWILGTKSLARAFKPYGIDVVKFYYGKGEEKLD